MKKKIIVLLTVSFITLLLFGCYPRLHLLQKEIEIPEGAYTLSDPYYCVIREEYTFIIDSGARDIYIPLFTNNEHQQLWKTSFRPAPEEKVSQDGVLMGRWRLTGEGSPLTIQLTGKGYLTRKINIYPMETNESGMAFYSYLKDGTSSWEQLRREVILSGDSFDAMKFGFATLMTEKSDLSLKESYEYLADIAREYQMDYTFPAGYEIRRGRLVPKVWFAFTGPRQEWWYIDLENARKENSFFYFGNIKSSHLIREYLKEYSSDYIGPASFISSDDFSSRIVRMRKVPNSSE